MFQNFFLENLKSDDSTQAIIGAVIVFHRRRGPGPLETAYRNCLAYELRKHGFEVIEKNPVPVIYDDLHMECGFRADLIVNGYE